MPVVKVADLKLKGRAGRGKSPETLNLLDRVKNLKQGDALVLSVPTETTVKWEMSRIGNILRNEDSLKGKVSIRRTAEDEIAVFHRVNK